MNLRIEPTYEVECDIIHATQFLNDIGNATLVSVGSTSTLGNAKIGDDITQRIRLNNDSKLEMLVLTAVSLDDTSDAVDEFAVECFSMLSDGKFASRGRSRAITIRKIVNDEGEDVLLTVKLFLLSPHSQVKFLFESGYIGDTINPKKCGNFLDSASASSVEGVVLSEEGLDGLFYFFRVVRIGILNVAREGIVDSSTRRRGSVTQGESAKDESKE